MSANSLQVLLRFLSQDAKVPLALAMSKVKDLQSADLDSPEKLAKTKADGIKHIFPDEKTAKQIISAAKRVSKKRAAGDDSAPSLRKKRKDDLVLEEPLAPAEQEKALELPYSSLEDSELAEAVLFTNRAPLVLAFAVTLLKYTMPEQPLSSRLSLAQAYVGTTSRSRAVSLGIESGKSAEEEGFGQGQPIVTVMGKELRVLRRWGYEWQQAGVDAEPSIQGTLKVETSEGSPGLKVEPSLSSEHPVAVSEDKPALWALDLEALKKSNHHGAPVAAQSGTHSNLPIYTPQSARAYLTKSFDSPPAADGAATKKPSFAVKAAERERNLGKLLKALDLVYESWADTLGAESLDKRTWSWYVKVRPEVESGVAGWGGKNEVKLAEILALRRQA